MPVEVTTVYTKERMLRYSKFVAASKKAFWIIMIICTVVCAGCVAFTAAVDALSIEMLMYGAIVLAMDILYVFMYLILPRITVKKAKNLNTTIIYCFEEDCFKISASNDYAQETSTVKYSLISKVGRRDNDLYLFISKNQAYIVDLSEISDEKADILINTIKACKGK